MLTQKIKKISAVVGFVLLAGLGAYGSYSYFSKNNLASSDATAAAVNSVKLSSDTTLTTNTESKKVYSINFSRDAGKENKKGCNNKEYTPDLGSGTNILGPFDFPVTLTFKGSVDDNLKINGDIVDKDSTLQGDSCSHHHDVNYSTTIPKGKEIKISVIDQHGGSVVLKGDLTLTNTVLKDVLTVEQKATTEDSYESGHIIATFEKGMTKDYKDNGQSLCKQIGLIFSSKKKKIESYCFTSFSSALDSINKDVSKYGKTIYLTLVHSHPDKVVDMVMPGGSSLGWPPSASDIRGGDAIKYDIGYVAETGNIWKYSRNESVAKEISGILDSVSSWSTELKAKLNNSTDGPKTIVDFIVGKKYSSKAAKLFTYDILREVDAQTYTSSFIDSLKAVVSVNKVDLSSL